MKDLIIGAVTDYNYDQIKPWFNSIKKSGYKGDIGLLAYNMKIDTLNTLKEEGLTYIFGMKTDDDGNIIYDRPNFNICVERFAHLHLFLRNLPDIDYIIATDVKDVIFQKNPSDWIRENAPNSKLILGTENLRYEDEPWGRNNLKMSFGPTIYENLKDNPIYCAGVIAGKAKSVTDLFMNIFLLCRGTSDIIPGGGGPDQAALNVLLSLDAYKSNTALLKTTDSFVCHVGTSIHAIKSGSGGIGQEFMKNAGVINTYKEEMLGPDCIMKDGLVCTESGEPYCIVHQYDRVSEWKDIMSKWRQ